MPHDPNTMSLLFSIGHWLIGAFSFPIAALVVWQAQRRNAAVPRIGIPLLLVAAGSTLALYIVFHAGVDDALLMLNWALRQPQQLQHFAFAALIVAMGVGEWKSGPRGGRAALVWPVGYIILGTAFIVHEQIGNNAYAKWLYHMALGVMIIVAGALRLVQRRGWLPWRPAGLGLAASLCLIGILLVSYRETMPL